MTRRSWVFLFPMLFVFSGGILAQPLKFVDTRWLLLAHPLFSSFDPSTKRFADSSSEPVPAGEEGIENLKTDLETKKKELLELPRKLSKKQKGNLSRAEKKALEEASILERKELEAAIKTIEERLLQVRQVPGRPGLTTGLSILPQVEAISGDIRRTIATMKSSWKGGIIDVAPLMPPSPPQFDPKVVFGNRHFTFWSPNFRCDPQALEWLGQAKNFLLLNRNLPPPVLVGGADGRVEALKILQKLTSGGRK